MRIRRDGSAASDDGRSERPTSRIRSSARDLRTSATGNRVRNTAQPSRRDRHDRQFRGPLAWPASPSMLTRSAAFDAAVLRSVEEAEHDWGVDAQHIEIGVEEVPPSDPISWEDTVPLGRAFPAEGKLRPRMVVYRLPIQTRSQGAAERDALVRVVVRTQLAQLLGRDIEDDL